MPRASGHVARIDGRISARTVRTSRARTLSRRVHAGFAFELNRCEDSTGAGDRKKKLQKKKWWRKKNRPAGESKKETRAFSSAIVTKRDGRTGLTKECSSIAFGAVFDDNQPRENQHDRSLALNWTLLNVIEASETVFSENNCEDGAKERQPHCQRAPLSSPLAHDTHKLWYYRENHYCNCTNQPVLSQSYLQCISDFYWAISTISFHGILEQLGILTCDQNGYSDQKISGRLRTPLIERGVLYTGITDRRKTFSLSLWSRTYNFREGVRNSFIFSNNTASLLLATRFFFVVFLIKVYRYNDFSIERSVQKCLPFCFWTALRWHRDPMSLARRLRGILPCSVIS